MTRTSAIQLVGAIGVAVWLGILTARVYRKPVSVPSHTLGIIGRTENLIPGTNIGFTSADNITTGQHDLTINNTSAANVSSVTGAGTVACSPTTGAVTCTGSGGSFSCSNLTSCTGGQLPVLGIAPGGGGQALFTDGSAVEWDSLVQDLQLQSFNGTGGANFLVVGLRQVPIQYTGIANGDLLTYSSTGPKWINKPPPLKLYANVSGSTFTIGTSLASCVTVGSVVVASGQNAYVTGMAWVVSTDGSVLHSVNLNITNVTNSGSGQVGQVDLGGTGGVNGDANLSGMNIDNSVGTFTYAAQLLRTGTLGTGTVTAHWCSIQAEVQ